MISPQSHLWFPQFKDFLDPKNPWFILEKKIKWSLISQDFGDVYAEKGRPGIATRVIVDSFGK